MNGVQRREKIVEYLQEVDGPVSGTELAGRLGVSRQVIVQDLALLRTREDLEILSTYQGYLLHRPQNSPTREFCVRHTGEQTEQELRAIVELGGRVEDVFVHHSVYGIVRGQLNIRSIRDVQNFMTRLRETDSQPIMRITGDRHYHTVTAEDAKTLELIRDRLEELGFLLQE